MAVVYTERYVAHDAGGGGIGTEGDPWTIVEGMANAAAGDRLNVKGGTYTLAAALSPANSGARDNPIEARGYASTIDDSDDPATSGVILDINGVNDDVLSQTKHFWTWKHLAYTGNTTRGQYGVNVTGYANVFYRCVAHDIGLRAFHASGIGTQFIGCEAYNFGSAGVGYGFFLGNYQDLCVGCYAHDSASLSTGFIIDNNRAGGAFYCLAYNNAYYGFRYSSANEAYPAILGHCIAHGNTRDGFLVSHATSGGGAILFNCVLSENGRYGIAADATGKGRVVLLGTAFYNNTLGEIDSDVEELELVPRITLTESPFVKASSDDFRLNRTARALLGSGFPQYFLNDAALTPWVGFPDVGAVCSGRGIGDVGEYGNHWTDTRRTWDGG